MGSHPEVTLYRSPMHSQHWIARSERSGWLIFPAKFRGWEERVPYPGPDLARLQPVPLWMAFNTGLLEAVFSRAA